MYKIFLHPLYNKSSKIILDCAFLVSRGRRNLAQRSSEEKITFLFLEISIWLNELLWTREFDCL